MELLKRINQAIYEFPEQASIVCDTYNGFKIFWMFDMAWCMVRYGARPIDYVRFEFHKKSARERDRYLTIFRYFRLAKKLKKSMGEANLIGCKTNEYQVFSGFIKRDWMIVEAQTNESDIRSFIKKHHAVIAKPNSGEQGKGVMKILSGNEEDIIKLITYKSTNVFVLEECLTNCDIISNVNPTSLNTIRATTFIDGKGKVHILSIILRVGAPNSHVDNWGAGGVGYNFDVETGICNCPGLDKKYHPYLMHPGSNVKMLGFEIPNYDELKQYIHKLALIEPKARYVGWDIAITPNGYELVEMNCPAGHDMFQSFNNPAYEYIKKNWK